ncbi:MAG TPA: MarR family transcriptional regulator [Aliidongia sp.]|nr:MarR family transcriptional regulator [Aliidongia sp.]
MATERKKVYSVRSIVAVFREFEQAAKQGEMNLTQYRFMLFLRNGPKRAGAIAATSFVTKATVSGQITALKEKGWIDVESDHADRRVSRVVLTDEGRAAMDAFEARLLACLENLIGDADQQGILAALGDLYIALGASRESRFTRPANEDAA